MVLRFCIQGRRGFIKNYNGWVFQNCTCHSHTLLLPTRELGTPLPNFSLKPFRKSVAEFQNAGGFRGLRTSSSVAPRQPYRSRSLPQRGRAPGPRCQCLRRLRGFKQRTSVPSTKIAPLPPKSYKRVNSPAMVLFPDPEPPTIASFLWRNTQRKVCPKIF